MEDTYSIVEGASELSLPTRQNRVTKSESYVLNFPTWSSRYKGFQAYMCVVMSYTNTLKFCEGVGRFGCEWCHVKFSRFQLDKLKFILVPLVFFVSILVPYLIFNIIIGVPAVLVEVMIGRYLMGNVTRAWNLCAPAVGVFWCLFILTVYSITLNYICNVYLLKYFFSSLFGYIRWGTCEESWSKINCYVTGKKSEAFARCLKTETEEFCRSLTWESSGTQFWKHSITNKSNPLDAVWSILCLIIAVLACTMIILKGIFSFEKLLGLLVYPAIIMWTTLVIVSLGMSETLQGLKKLCYEHWEYGFSLEAWMLGFENSLYFLGLGRLSLSFISSHGRVTDNILYDVLTVNFCGFVACVLVTTPVLSIAANTKSLDRNGTWEELFLDVTDTFISMSEALLFYPYPSTLWAAMYYLVCFLISCTSQAVMVLAVCEALEGLIKKEGIKFFVLIGTSIFMFIIALAASFFQIIYKLSLTTAVLVNIVLCTLTWQAFFGIRKFNSVYYVMMGYRLPIFIKCTWITLLIGPFVMLVLKTCYSESLRNIVFIWVGIAVSVYTFNIIFKLVRFKKKKLPLLQVFKANPKWVPDNVPLNKTRMMFDANTLTTEFMYRQELYKKSLMKPPNFSNQNVVQLI